MRGWLVVALALVASGCAFGGRRPSDPPADASATIEDAAAPAALDGGAPRDAGGEPDANAGNPFPPGTTCTPGFGCPAGAVFRLDGEIGRCLWEGIELPVASDVRPYCSYFDRGYVGFSWRLSDATGGDYRCPSGARHAPNDTLGYCLWEDFVHPGAASADCEELVSHGRIGFRWPCP